MNSRSFRYDVIIVGAGIFGLTVAQRLAYESGLKILVLEKRDHIGGNAYSYFESTTGIEVHKYGAHIFHTSNKRVWEYVNKFSSFTNYQHRVWTTYNQQVYSMPINLSTINQFFQTSYSPDEAKQFIKQQIQNNYQFASTTNQPRNLVEQGISLIGEPLFNAFIKNYTAKQWQTPPEELDASIITRLPVRFDYNNRYFNDAYEGLPEAGYEQFFINQLAYANSSQGKVDVKLETDFFAWRKLVDLDFNTIPLLFTGPIDAYFEYSYGKLKWRSLDLRLEIVDCTDFQGCSVMNYSDLDVAYTRIHEFKHFHPERTSNPDYQGYATNNHKTVIVREYSKNWQVGDEQYYPVGTPDDLDKLNHYCMLASRERNLYFGGRLGEYKYYDMDKVFASALKFADNFIQNYATHI